MTEIAPRRLAALALAAWLGSSALAVRALAADELPKLGADLAATSVSGLSSGAYMAGQIQVAHAKDIVGAGIVAGGPYACAESPASRIFPFWPTAVAQNGTQALYQCMETTLGEPDPVRSAERAKELAEDGAIDPIAGLAADNVYLFSGKKDDTVKLAVVQAAKRFYKEVGVDETNTTLIEGDGGHALITAQGGGVACGVSDTPYVSNCGYNQAEAILAWIYGPLADPSAEAKGRFIVFDQGAILRARRRVCRRRHGLRPGSLRESAGLPGAYRAAWLRAVARGGRTIVSSKAAALPRSPTPTGSSCCSRKSRPARSTRKAAGIGGAIPGSIISARTRRRSRRSGPWSSS